MAWWNPMTWFDGVDLDDEIERGQRLDRELAELNQRRVEEGKMTPEQYQHFIQNNEWTDENYRQEIYDEFWAQFGDYWDRIVDVGGAFISGAVTGPARTAADLVEPITNRLVDAGTEIADAGKKVITFWLILQWGLAALALYLVYRYFLATKR